VRDLETLEAVAAFSLATDNVEDLINKLGTLSVMTLGPVVASTGLTENEVVGTEELAEGTGTDGVHCAGLKIDEDSAGNILVTRSLVKEDQKVSMSAIIAISIFWGRQKHTSLK
jgi:hypothetical protein